MSVRARILVAAGVVVATGAFVALRPANPEAERPPAHAAQRSGADPVAAATRFLTGLDLRTMLDAQRRRDHIVRWSSLSASDELQQIYTSEAERLRGLRRGVARAALVGYRVGHRTAARASVEIWAVSLASTGQAPPTTAWRTIAVDLVLERTRWRVDGVRDIPGPALDMPPRLFRTLARQFRRFHVAP